MELRQVLNMLQGVSGPNASGEYTAKCPAHEDGTASMTLRVKPSPKDGKERIYLTCHAGCTNDAILEALRLTNRDLIVNPDPDWKPGRKGAGRGKARSETGAGSRGPEPSDADAPPETTETIQGVTVHTVGRGSGAPADGGKPQGKADGPQIDWGHPDQVYSYTDAAGKEIFQVVRYHYTNAEGKTFRQRRRDPADPKANREGYVNSVPAELRDSAVYRLPEVLQAIADGKPVYVVEGEKDADTLRRLGFCATCNAGGAGGSEDGKGGSRKGWQESHSRLLHGADAILLPDNDEPGYRHVKDVALKLRNYAARIRMVNLAEACPELPKKGDISDMVALMGDVKAMDALARQVAITPDFDPNGIEFWRSPEEQAERLYGTVTGYGVRDGCIVQVAGETTKALTDFFVIPRMELIQDDGVNQAMSFVMDGWNSSQKKLGRVTIPAGNLDSMDWVTKSWGFSASMTPGSTVKQKVVWAIKKVGQVTARRVTEYTHSGFRKIGQEWCYLYNGGAIGMDGVTVDMGDWLKAYRLDGSGAEGFDRIPYAEAARTSLRIKDIMKEEIGIALLGTMYLAPLREWLSRSDIVPAFALFLYGPTGNHKTTAATLALSHFGNFHAKAVPASFSDTGNQIRMKAFRVKDMPILVDDFHPVSSQQERRQRDAVAQALSRSFGDGADRGRLNADGTIRAAMPPRSVAMITGEDLPSIGASGLARFFIVDIDQGDIPITDNLTEMQELARKGYLQRAMRGYILWLLKQADTMPERLHDLYLKFRADIRQESEGQHDRAPETVACILIGYAMMLDYFRGLKLIDAEEAARMLGRARRQLMNASRKQAKTLESEKPTRIFLDGLSELLSSRTASVVDLTADTVREPYATERMIGYMDGDYYYLLPNLAFSAVARLCREEGTEFPVSLKALYKHLRTDGILELETDAETPTKVKRVTIAGVSKPVRALWIPAELISGPKAAAEQMSFREVKTELPEEW
ncbi:MAG: hypothetical protein J6U01_06820 [Clostridia bacterium]|nr:hypothetical protein [Clostridia bacterium]